MKHLINNSKLLCIMKFSQNTVTNLLNTFTKFAEKFSNLIPGKVNKYKFVSTLSINPNVYTDLQTNSY